MGLCSLCEMGGGQGLWEGLRLWLWLWLGGAGTTNDTCASCRHQLYVHLGHSRQSGSTPRKLILFCRCHPCPAALGGVHALFLLREQPV